MTRLEFSLFSLYLACCLLTGSGKYKKRTGLAPPHTHSSGDLEIDFMVYVPDWMGIVHENEKPGARNKAEIAGQTTGGVKCFTWTRVETPGKPPANRLSCRNARCPDKVKRVNILLTVYLALASA